MKYSHSSKHRKNCRHDPETRAQLGFRLRYARLRLGWSISEAGKYFQVTERTWHNWETGTHRIPFAVYKLARVLARLELPGAAWAGWRLEGSSLITPEGRQIAPQDGSWWSLLVRQAQSFRTVYAEASRLRLTLAELVGRAEGAGLVPSKTTQSCEQIKPLENSQNDIIMTLWPILCDSPTPSTLPPAPAPTTLGFPSTPSFALPWTPTCGIRLTLNRPALPHLTPSPPHLKQSTSRSQPGNPPSSPEPKNRRSTNGTKPLAKPSPASNSVSARPAAAQAAKLASAAGGAQ